MMIQATQTTRSFRNPAPAAVSPEEQRELDSWVKRHQPELGLLQSPPIGPAVGDKASNARRYLQNLVQDLAGNQLKENDIELRVEIYSGDIAQVALDDSTTQEKAWEAKNPGKPWPIRSWLEAPKQGDKPLYRLAVSQGLIETLETREEVAFVLAHQLQHLLDHHAQDPNNEQELRVQGKSWLESRSFQLQNDSAALKMMSDANLNPKGALGALDKLYRKFGPTYPKDDQKAALTAAAAVQEHEGIRFSALQLQVENLRRSGHPAASSPTQQLPPEIVAKASGGYQVQMDNFAAFQQGMCQLADSLGGEETPEWMFSQRSQAGPLQIFKDLRPNPEEYEKALLGVCQHLTQSSPSPQERINRFLRLALALDGECLPREFSSQGTETLRAFLAANQEWSAAPFLQSLEREGKSLHRELARDVSLNGTFQAVVAGTTAPGFAALIEATPRNFCQDPESATFDIGALPSFFASNSPSALADAYNQAALNLLARQDVAHLTQEAHESGVSQGMVLANDLRTVDNLNPDFALRLAQARQPLEMAVNATREEKALLRLRPPLTEASKIGAYLQEFFASESGGHFSPDFEGRLPALLLDVARTCNQQQDFVFEEGRPGELDPGLQGRLTGLLASAAPEDKKQLVRFLCRTWPHELRLPGHSPRREAAQQLASHLQKMEPAELLAQLTTQDVSQHEQLLRKTLMDGYGLTDLALPDASTESLAALNARASAGEFRPQRANFQDSAAYEKAEQAYQAALQGMQSVARFVAPAESRLVLSQLAILGHREETSRQVASRLKLPDFVSILENTESVLQRSRLVRQVTGDYPLEVLGSDAGAFLIDGFLAVESKIQDLDVFYDLARRSVEVCPPAIEARNGTRSRIADALCARLQKLEPDALRSWLGKDHVLGSLRPEQTSNLMISLIGDLAKPGASVDELGAAVAQLDKSFKLRDKHGLAYVLLRDSVTEQARLQPDTLNQVFPSDESSPIEGLRQFRPQLAGLSGLIAMTRNHPPQVQLATLEYLMGRSDEMPEFLAHASENQSLGPVAQTIRNARESLSEADTAMRVVVANSFLAGPNGLLQTEGGRDTVLEHFLSGVKPKALKLARPMTQAILTSQGDADSLAVAVVLGQKPKKGGASKLTEADILSRVFDSYGVPGVKMKQYLAFTSQFEHYREAFEDAQDSANPLNYYETISMIQKRFGSEWPEDFEVDKVLGSGSVNVAIRYKNKATGKREVVSLGREDIVEQTNYDFDRFRRFVEALTSTEEGQANFGFIKGLTGIIADSVELEFDKETVMAVQKQAFETYRHQFDDGWTLRSIDAYQVKNLGLFMEEAKGKTARKILSEKPALYQEAMRHVARSEFNLLKGRGATNNLIPKANFANPDIHDGQVLIDEATKTATVLDFGQAVPIDNHERALGLDLLTVLGKLSTARGAAKRLNKKFFPKDFQGEGITKEEIRSLWKSPKKMDMFIRLLALVSEKGGKVPLSTVHWVLALNRQFVLGEKLDQSIQGQVVGMVVNHRLGLGLGAFNTVQAASEKVAQWSSSLASGVAGLVTGWCQKEELEETQESTHLFRSVVPDLPKEPEKGWRDASSYAFYLDDFEEKD